MPTTFIGQYKRFTLTRLRWRPWKASFSVTQFEQDLWKIGVDKVALALVVGGLGLYFNRRLEKYRARNVFVQKLVDRKVEGLEKLALILQQQLFRIRHLVNVLQRAPGADRFQSGQYIKDAYNKFSVDFHDLMPQVLQIVGLYLPIELKNVFISHQKVVGQFNALVQSPKLTSEIIQELNRLAENMIHSFSDLQVAVREEIKKPPF